MNGQYESLARLLEYPDESYVERCRQAGLEELAATLAPLSAGDIQERFIAAFDWNPATALEIGWHIYGEQYARGEFMVRLREQLRHYAIPESAELPDHLIHVLRLLARMDEAAALQFTRYYLAPAVAKIASALENLDSPFALLIRAIRDALPCRVDLPPAKVELPVLQGGD